jgi:CO/xanthine dehydrogenase Mo-binding subunit
MKIAEAFFATETHASRISELSLQDPATWRKANLSMNSPLPGANISWNPERGAALLDSVSGRSDFKRKYAAYESARKRRKTIRSTQWALRGIGLALAWSETGFFPGEEPEMPYSVTVRLEQG